MKRFVWPWVAGLVLLFVVIPVFLSGSPPVMDAYMHLLVGWSTFLPGRASAITVNWSGVGMLLVCLACTIGFAHSFCAWLWRSGGRAEPWRPRWTLTGVAALVLLFVSGMAVTGLCRNIDWLVHSPEPLANNHGVARKAISSLRSIFNAQGEFRAKDSDGNKIHDYWRDDIAGLYALEKDGMPIKLLDLSIALADLSAKRDMSIYGTLSTKGDYWVRALRHATEKEPGPDRFAACAFPANSRSRGMMFILCEDGVIYRKQFQGEAPAVYPENPKTDGWDKID